MKKITGNIVEYDGNEEYKSISGSNAYLIHHKFGKFALVITKNSFGKIIHPDIKYLSETELMLLFDEEFSGTLCLKSNDEILNRIKMTKDLILKNITNNAPRKVSVLTGKASIHINLDRARNIIINDINFYGVFKLIIDFDEKGFTFANVYIPIGNDNFRIACIQFKENNFVDQIIQIDECINENPRVYITLK